mgnify:CR=1 FL=1
MRLVEELWDSIAADQQALPLTDEQRNMASGSIAGSSATSGDEGWSGDIERATC